MSNLALRVYLPEQYESERAIMPYTDFELSQGREYFVGRKSDSVNSDINLGSSRFISRNHGKLEVNPEDPESVLYTNQSPNYPIINSSELQEAKQLRIRQNLPTRLNKGDMLDFKEKSQSNGRIQTVCLVELLED